MLSLNYVTLYIRNLTHYYLCHYVDIETQDTLVMQLGDIVD